MALIVKIGANLRDFDRQMRRVTREISYLGNKLQGVGKQLTTKVTLPILGIGAASTKLGMEFEKSMSEVSAVTGATGEEFDKLEKLAREMGSKTSKSASEAADAIKYMGLAGWDTSQIMKGLEPVLRLSEAGNIDLGRASDLVTDSMSALGLTTEELRTYLDQMAQTSRKSNTNIDQLAEAMIVAGGTLKNLNVPLDEANALFGILANRGKKGSEAGNSLNSILINLTSGAGQAGKAMEELGLSAFDSNGKFKGIGNVLKELKEKLSGLTEEQKKYLSCYDRWKNSNRYIKRLTRWCRKRI
ncbi:phage tail tape measure protein [Paramaledivibacter caminithermalis]|uniref:Phage tail tape measure protein, TP901 family, core region n=1 Tax=Paramaledivibacter caminithermalis (strain DSM 15212 / CIP 107654 / DViRD3) TaxID=1121301 RepID=A0A1M6SWU2_PARC5|nr:phage tail tape measure protein [Paramaledivibacter caminithermalis]SHK49038.1 phage tail tape measure protein, TP901 family, core region [Paramaledivibacter caminithermalis DSM 15212]